MCIWLSDMRSEWDKCYFCIYYDEYDGCDGFGCEFELSENKVIEKAKEKEISCADVIALIRW